MLHFDAANQRYNYSVQTEVFENMEWIYPLLMKYFETSNEKKMELYYSDIDASRKNLFAFINTECTGEQRDLRANAS